MLSIPLFASYKPVLFIMPISPSVAWLQPLKCDGELTWLKRLNLQLPHTNVCVVALHFHIYLNSNTYIHVTHGTHERGTA